MINYIDNNKKINLTIPIEYKEPIKPYIDTSNITDWSYFFQNGRRVNEWDFKNTDFINGIDFSYFMGNSSDFKEEIIIDAPKATNYTNAFAGVKNRKVTVNTESAENMSAAFRGSHIEEVEFIGTTAKSTTFSNCFNGCNYIKSIKGLDFSGVTAAFGITSALSCPELEDCIVTGNLKIMSSNFRLNSCPKLSRDSVVSFAKAIEDNSGETKTYTLYFGAENLEKLTEEEKAELIAKNFILA